MRRKTLSMTRETVDTACDSSPDWRTTIGTQRAWGIEGEFLHIHDDAGQILLTTAWTASTDYHYRLTTGVVGTPQWDGQGVITNMTIEGATNDVVSRTLSVQGNGTLVETTVTP
jgi:predicted secreted protein